jgi:hypothetical protein
LAVLGIRGYIGVSGHREKVNMTYETHIVYLAVQETRRGSASWDKKAREQDAQLVIVNFCIGTV